MFDEYDENWSELYATVRGDGEIEDIMLGVSADEPDDRHITLYQVNDMQNWDSIYLSKDQVKTLIDKLTTFL